MSLILFCPASARVDGALGRVGQPVVEIVPNTQPASDQVSRELRPSRLTQRQAEVTFIVNFFEELRQVAPAEEMKPLS